MRPRTLFKFCFEKFCNYIFDKDLKMMDWIPHIISIHNTIRYKTYFPVFTTYLCLSIFSVENRFNFQIRAIFWAFWKNKITIGLNVDIINHWFICTIFTDCGYVWPGRLGAWRHWYLANYYLLVPRKIFTTVLF